MSDHPALSYRVVAPLSANHQAGRWVATWVPVGCIAMAVLAVLRDVQRIHNLQASFNGVWLRTLVNMMPWLGILAGIAVVITSLGLVLRGERFRWWCIGSLMTLTGLRAILAVGFIADEVVAGWGGVSPSMLLNSAAVMASAGVELPLPVLAVIILTRPWVREALTEGLAESTTTGLRIAASIGAATGGLGVLSLAMPFMSTGRYYSPGDTGFLSRLSTSLPYFDDVWVGVFTFVLSACCIASLVGGIAILRRRKWGATWLLSQAVVSVIFSTSYLAMSVCLMYVLPNPAHYESLPATAAIRLFSLAIDFGLWMYLGSERTRWLIEQGKFDPEPQEVHVATVA